MRKTLFAMLGLVAIAMWALPALALPGAGGLVVDGPKVDPGPSELSNRAGNIGSLARGERMQGALMSGTLLKQTAVTTSWFLYPGACVQRALGTWSAKSSPVADSLQPTAGYPNSSGYTDNQPDIPGNNNTIAYTRFDGSLPEALWHVVNVGTPAGQRPDIIDGSNSLWCGKFDGNWAVDVGYPNLTFQILYIDTGVHSNPGATPANTWHLTFTGNLCSEQNYDYNSIIGGGSSGTADHTDPLQNRRDLMSDFLPPAGVATSGPHGDSDQIVTFTGSILTDQTVSQNHSGVLDNGIVVGSASAQPVTVNYDITIDDDHRAIYWIFTADCLFSSEDGLWPLGHGQIIDLISMTNSGVTTSLYNDQAAAGGTDPFSGNIIKGTYGSAGFISSRVPAGVGELWQLAPGNENVTADICTPQKAFSTDLFFEGGDPNTNLAVNKQFNGVVSCAFPVPTGSASILALWNAYFDLPRFSGYAQDAEFRYFKDGGWSGWQDTDPGGSVNTGANQAWLAQGNELGAAVQADSVQIRWEMRCIPPFAADRTNCSTTQANALLYDDFRLQVLSGVPAPIFGIFPGSVAQTTFVDGVIGSTVSGPPANCGAKVNQCWPGNRGSGLGNPSDHNIAVNDNWNAPTGDSITLAIVSGLRKNGMGVNWQYGVNKQDATGGEDYRAYTNDAFTPAFDSPRMIYRLFDPATRTWSAFDSALVYATVQISGPDTTIVGGGAPSEYIINWPPDDKVRAGASLPGGFTINGDGAYASLAFLPKGTRMQYYFKGVDIGGGVSYIFSSDNLAREVEDLPTLPGSSNKAPDIIEWRVLPSVYPAGPAGSLLAGKTDADILNMDDVYTRWSFGYDPMVQALRGLGVRSDRYRHTSSGTTAHDIGGHELPGTRPDRLSNFIPNYLEYPLVDSLASWYRIMIESGHTQTVTAFSEQDAIVAQQWWAKDTGSNQGDRCFFVSGDDVFNTLLNTTGVVTTNQVSLAQDVFGVSSSTNAWSGTNSTPYPTIDDRFAAASAGPALAAANTYTYPVDGGCPGPNRFDAFVKVGSGEAASAVFYPNSQIAGIARMSERDAVADKDRNKAMAYGFSIQFIRDPAYGITNANYTHSGVENRMRVLYKFLTSCRGPRTSAPADTGKCWPCPSPGTTLALMQADWAGQSAGFVTGTWGPLLAIQAGALATGVDVGEGGEGAPRINKINGNFPNPFNPQTAIRFQSAQAGKSEIRIFNVGGQLVRTLHANVTQGPNEVRWNGKKSDGTPLASGVYFYKIVFPNGESFRAPNNLVLVK
jgi:hypothetical protein